MGKQGKRIGRPKMSKRKRGKGLPKAIRQRQHAKAMAKKRYGVKLNSPEYRSLVSQIKNSSGGGFIARISNTRTAHQVVLPATEERPAIKMKAIYDKSRGELVTILAQDMEIYIYE